MDTGPEIPRRPAGPRETSRDPSGAPTSGFPVQPSQPPAQPSQTRTQQPTGYPDEPFASGGYPTVQSPRGSGEHLQTWDVSAPHGYGRQQPSAQQQPQQPSPQPQYSQPQQPPAQQFQPQHSPGVQPSGAPYSGRGSDELGVRETSGVEVRIGSSRSERNRIRREQRGRDGRRKGLLAGAAVLVVAAAAAGAFVLVPGSDGGKKDGATASAGGGSSAPVQSGRMPKTGTPVTVGTADGNKYQLAAVDTGTGDGASTQQTAAPSGYGFAYVEYVLSNPTHDKVLLDYPGDVFVKRTLVESAGRGRCMPQLGAPEDMCTPPTHSDVVRTLRGGQLVKGDGEDKYLPPGSAYLVRATVDVPVEKELKTGDLRLFIWKRLYMANADAKEAPLPR
ncbi:hypothetical protein AB0L06_13645 [Spirillospora sp. NPDC052269]